MVPLRRAGDALALAVWKEGAASIPGGGEQRTKPGGNHLVEPVGDPVVDRLPQSDRIVDVAIGVHPLDRRVAVRANGSAGF